MKDEDGQVVEFEEEEPEAAATTVKKKKAKVPKTERVGTELGSAQVGASMIEAEDTLAMIKNALKSGNPDTIDSVKKAKKGKKKKEKMPKLEENIEEATQE